MAARASARAVLRLGGYHRAGLDILNLRSSLMRPARLYFFGDSICVGQHVSIHRGWVPRLSAWLEEQAPDWRLDVSVTNAAVNGRTTRQALEDMPYQVQSHRPELLLVQFGMNDCNYWKSDAGLPRVSLRAFQANLEEIAERGLAAGARCVILQTNHPTPRDVETFPFTETTYQQSNRRYNEAIREVADRLDSSVVRLNDIESQFDAQLAEKGLGPQDIVLDDLLHLNVLGHDLYYDMARPVIESAIEEFLLS